MNSIKTNVGNGIGLLLSSNTILNEIQLTEFANCFIYWIQFTTPSQHYLSLFLSSKKYTHSIIQPWSIEFEKLLNQPNPTITFLMQQIILASKKRKKAEYVTVPYYKKEMAAHRYLKRKNPIKKNEITLNSLEIEALSTKFNEYDLFFSQSQYITLDLFEKSKELILYDWLIFNIKKIGKSY